MRLILALLLVVGVLADDEECPDFDCPVKDGSFAVSTPLLVMIYKVDPRTLAHAVGITLASTSAQSNSIALLASTGTISSEEISVFWHQDCLLSKEILHLQERGSLWSCGIDPCPTFHHSTP